MYGVVVILHKWTRELSWLVLHWKDITQLLLMPGFWELRPYMNIRHYFIPIVLACTSVW